MPYIDPMIVAKAKEMDLFTYLSTYEPGELVRFSANVYSTKTHDSLKISNGKWMWWSQGIGGRSALDYLIKVRGMSFTDAVCEIIRAPPTNINPAFKEEENHQKTLVLPKKNITADRAISYLLERGIDREIIDECLSKGLIYESLPYHNIVFIGLDDDQKPGYAMYRAANKTRIMGDCLGSQKQFSFRLGPKTSESIHLFEGAIDVLSYATLERMDGKDYKKESLISLGGIYSPLKHTGHFKVPEGIKNRIQNDRLLKRIVLHLDKDAAGREASKSLIQMLEDRFEVIDETVPYGKDVNDFLCRRLHEKQKKERSFTDEYQRDRRNVSGRIKHQTHRNER